MFRKMLFATLVLAAVLVAFATRPSAAAQLQDQSPIALQPQSLSYFEAVLSGGSEVPVVQTDAWGRAVMVLDDTDNTLYWRVVVNDITAVTMAHIHAGLPGEDGGVVLPLFTGTGVFDPSNPISGTVTLTAEQVTALESGGYYVNVHTAANTGGEIRGQVEPFTPGTLNAVLHGSSEVPPVSSMASGWALFNLTGSALDYEIHVTDVPTITMAHLHTGLPGQSNPPSVPIYAPGDARPFDPGNPITGTLTLTGQQVLDVLSGYNYLNVHTTANPGGEMRGQVTSGLQTFRANMRGSEEVPPVDTPARGELLAVLDSDLHTFHYNITVTDMVSITVAHLHPGLPGESGPPDVTLYNGTGTFDPQHPWSDVVTLTDEQVSRLVAGGYYANVHSADHPTGEIRGQVYAFEPVSDYFAEMTGANETPPVETTATGMGELRLLPGLNAVQYEIQVTGTMTITAAHLHPGFPGESNPPSVPLYGPGDPRPFSPTEPLSGIAPLNAADLLNILSGRMYMNVHTQLYPAGEIRGQVTRFFFAYLPAVFVNYTFPAP